MNQGDGHSDPYVIHFIHLRDSPRYPVQYSINWYFMRTEISIAADQVKSTKFGDVCCMACGVQ